MKGLFLCFSLGLGALHAFAQEHFDGMRLRENKAMVTALEAPLFPAPSAESKVVQYVRKGEEIYIHPAEFAQDRYEGLVKADPKTLRAYAKDYEDRFQDPLFSDSSLDGEDGIYRPDPSSPFYRTLTNDGQEAYVLKEHVYLLTNDLRELEQDAPAFDNTDYRIEEPLPKGFPFKQPPETRTYVSAGLGIPSEASFPYKEDIADTGYGFLKEFSAVWSSNKEDVSDRFFFGANLSLSLHEVEHRLQSAQATENSFKISLGPYASWDFWRTESFLLNVFGSIQFVFWDYLEIEQRLEDGSSDKKSFTARHFSPRAGLILQMPKKFFALDVLAGIAAQAQMKRTYRSDSESQSPSLWGGDEFTQDFSAQVTYFLGLQSRF